MENKRSSIMKKIGSCTLALAMIAGISFTASEIGVAGNITANAAAAADIVESGSCGDGLTYTIDSSGVLTVTGAGQISGSAFANNKNIKQVVLADSVSAIGYSAFSGCTNLESVQMNGVESIYGGAFNNTGLKHVRVPDTCTSLGAGAFANCGELTDVQLSYNLKSIQGGTFQGCKKLEEVNIPDSCTYIGFNAFDYCDSLKKLVIPNKDANFAPFAFGYYHHDTSTYVSFDNVYWVDGECYYSSKVHESKFSTMSTALHTNFGHTKYLGFTVYGATGSNLQKYCKGLNMYVYVYSMMVGDPDDPFNAYYPDGHYETLYFDNQLAFSPITTVIDTGIDLNKTSMTLALGQTTSLVATVSPSNATDQSVVWTTSNENVASVVDGKVVAKAKGTANIKATSKNGHTKSCKITVLSAEEAKRATKVELDKTSLHLYEYGTEYLTATVSPETADPSVEWTSSNPEVATVDNDGKVTAVAAGTATITATANSGVKATCEVDVRKFELLTNNSSISAKNITLGEKVTVTAAGTGGTGPYTYEVTYKKSTDTKWTTKQAYGENASINIKPGAAATYTVKVRVKDSTGTVSAKNLTVNVYNELENDSSVSANAIVLGDKVTVKAAAKGGSGKYTYEVTYKKSTDTKWATKQAYSTNASVNIKPGAAADYIIKVRVKDSVTGKVVGKNLTVKVNAEEPLTNTSTISSTSIKLGEKVTVNAAGAGGTGPYTYEVTYKKSTDTNWATKQAYSENASVSVKPAAATKYTVKVRVKDSKGTVVGKNFTVNVTAPLTNTSTISSTSIKLGEKVTVTAAGAGGTGPYTYEVTYKKSTDTKWATKQAYGTNTGINIKPGAAATYTVKVRIKDSEGTIVGKNFTVKVS